MKNNLKRIKLEIEGMTCSNCAAGVKKHLLSKGLEDVNVNFSSGEVSCNIDNLQNQNDVENIIQKLGYLIVKPNNKNKKKISKVERYFYSTLIFTLPLFSHMFFSENSIIQNPILQFFLCLPVYIIGVSYFGKSAWSSLKTGIPNMDVLIFIGSSAAFFYSIYGWLIFGGTSEMHYYLFFETTATIITLVLLGNVLEHKSVQKTTSAIKDLSSIQEVSAKVEANGVIKEVSFENIKIGDIIIVNSGDKIPTDGIIMSGSAYIDESMITGESIPTNKNKESEVIGGTIIIDGNVKIKASKVGKDTLLSQIIELVKNAQNNKPNIQKIGDKISAVFVPVVLFIAFLTFFIGHYYFLLSTQEALLRGIAVLVISCPCAMGLATPTAVMVGIGRAAKNGILIKGGESLEKLSSVKSIVFDKTGTLTTGKFIVSKFNAVNEDEKKIKNIIYNIEKHSSHPIAKSLCNAFKDYNSTLELKNIIEEKGVSISAEIDDNLYSIGSSKIIISNEKHDLFVLKNNRIIATLDISDELKTNTDLVISTLHKSEYTTTILSGDKKAKCDEISEKLGIKTTFSEQLPQDKITKIEELVDQHPTAMVGDGINDAPALARATIGISLGNATQIAIQSADVVLLNNENLQQLPKALKLGKHTLLTIKQNLFWAFSYNLVAIPIAFLGLLNPMWAALFMAFSDIIVIGNSIRLRYKKIF